jgi:hypothetical protein
MLALGKERAQPRSRLGRSVGAADPDMVEAVRAGIGDQVGLQKSRSA